MATNIKKFLKNYKRLKEEDSDYVIYDKRVFVDDLKVCICIEPFYHDDLLIEKGNVYLLRRKSSNAYAIYEITGLWKYMGHDAGILTYKALNDVLKGWNIPGKYVKYLKVINIEQLHTFIYWEDK